MMVPPIKYGFEPHYQSFKKGIAPGQAVKKSHTPKKCMTFPNNLKLFFYRLLIVTLTGIT